MNSALRTWRVRLGMSCWMHELARDSSAQFGNQNEVDPNSAIPNQSATVSNMTKHHEFTLTFVL